jgi:hypothetical protein
VTNRRDSAAAIGSCSIHPSLDLLSAGSRPNSGPRPWEGSLAQSKTTPVTRPRSLADVVKLCAIKRAAAGTAAR